MVKPSPLAFSPRKLIPVTPPAPAMFCTMIVGLPGMCLARWRATIRPSMSVGPPALKFIKKVMFLPCVVALNAVMISSYACCGVE